MICTSIYFSAKKAREKTIIQRLSNRAKTTARLLSQREIFQPELVRRIDSFTTIALTNKVVQAYDHHNERFYNYSEDPLQSFPVDTTILNDARVLGSRFFESDEKEAVALHYTDNDARMVVVAAGEDTDGRSSLQALQRILLLSFLTGNLVVLALGYFFSGRLLSPVRKITRDVAEISAHNLVRRLPAGKVRDEWHHLAVTLNELLNRLQESFDMQRRFIANASHELSTPLTSISSQMEVALQRERDAEEYRQVIQSAYQDVKRMSRLTHTLLEFAKASGNTGGLELSDIRIDEIILDIPAQLAKLNASYTVILHFEDLPEEEERLVVYGNEPLLETALKNMVVNACKYSPDHRAVIRLQAKNNSILISIEDNGVGIPQDQLKAIFQPFYRVEESTAKTTTGFGLGLSLSYRIIRLHKGDIQVKSTVNQGTIFQVELPVARLS
jgi:signal transduction histidine kinase